MSDAPTASMPRAAGGERPAASTVTAHRGRVSVHSVEGRGTAFTVALARSR